MSRSAPMISRFRDCVAAKDDSVLLETHRCDSENYMSFLFTDPVEILEIDSVDHLGSIFDRIEEALARGYYCAGYFSYECGHYFEKLPAYPETGSPVAWFGVYKDPLVADHRHDGIVASLCGAGEYRIDGVRFVLDGEIPDGTEERYVMAVDTIRRHIELGDIYQLNFTGKSRFRFSGSAIALYGDLLNRQRTSYSAYLRCGGRIILSLSPELFYRRRGDRIIVRPMKGTVRRGTTPEENARLRSWLSSDGKNRAENVMIVDLLRNDLGRIAVTGSVEVTSLYTVEEYETLFQMTSTVHARIRPGVTNLGIFEALFPSGSVTGAPKIRAMQSIHGLETEPRGIYTGAIGYFSPNGESVFNVAIRTLVLDGDRGEMGIGSGVVWDSDAKQEFDECLLKSVFLDRLSDDFEIFESILWSDGYRFLEDHLNRMSGSACYFHFNFNPFHIRKELDSLARGLAGGCKYKVRMSLRRGGEIAFTSTLLDEPREGEIGIIALSPIRTDSRDRFLCHKTSLRSVYNEEYRRGVERDCVDVVFLNERDEITEGAISNIFIRFGNRLLTPPLQCGLLDGIYRQFLLRSEPHVSQEVLRLNDLCGADAVYICNAVRGMRQVRLEPGIRG